MGIDPITHKPISTVTDEPQTQQQPEQLQHQKEEEQKQQQASLTDTVSEIDQSKELETETSLQSSSVTEAKEEDKSTSPFDPMELMNGFCIDEVPIIEPHEILVQCAPSSSTSTSSSTCSNSSNLFQDLQFPDFEWPCDYNNSSNNSMGLWNDDFSSWDLLINDDGDRADFQSFSESVSKNGFGSRILGI